MVDSRSTYNHSLQMNFTGVQDLTDSIEKVGRDFTDLYDNTESSLYNLVPNKQKLAWVWISLGVIVGLFTCISLTVLVLNSRYSCPSSRLPSNKVCDINASRKAIKTPTSNNEKNLNRDGNNCEG